MEKIRFRNVVALMNISIFFNSFPHWKERKWVFFESHSVFERIPSWLASLWITKAFTLLLCSVVSLLLSNDSIWLYSFERKINWNEGGLLCNSESGGRGLLGETRNYKRIQVRLLGATPHVSPSAAFPVSLCLWWRFLFLVVADSDNHPSLEISRSGR